MFRLVGVSLYTPASEAEVVSVLNRLVEEQYAIILVTEQVYEMAPRAIQAMDGRFLPAVIILPGYGEDGQAAMRRVNELMANALGTTV